MYMSSFVAIGSAVPEKNILKIFFTIYGHGGHLGHVNMHVHTTIVQNRFMQYISTRVIEMI